MLDQQGGYASPNRMELNLKDSSDYVMSDVKQPINND